jgi:glycosyltransferase involved in cell wall biosynthesis
MNGILQKVLSKYEGKPKMEYSALSIVIPAYNEAEGLKILLPQWINYCRTRGWKIIVIDDGSVDNTKLVLRDFHSDNDVLRLFHFGVNRGYGGALKRGITLTETEFVVTIDADGQHSVNDIDRLFKIMIDSRADLVIGSRKDQKSKSLYRGLGKWIIRQITKILMPINVYDINSGFKLYKTKLVKEYISLCPDGMAFSDIITLIFISQKHLVLEHPISISERLSGQSTISTRTAFETLIEILNIIMLFNPLRIFLPASIISFFIGVIWGIPFILLGRGVSVGAMLAISTGITIFLLGLVSEQLSLARKARILAVRDELEEYFEAGNE